MAKVINEIEKVAKRKFGAVTFLDAIGIAVAKNIEEPLLKKTRVGNGTYLSAGVKGGMALGLYGLGSLIKQKHVKGATSVMSGGFVVDSMEDLILSLKRSYKSYKDSKE